MSIKKIYEEEILISNQIKAIVTQQLPPRNKKNETNKGNMLQSDDILISNMRVRKF